MALTGKILIVEDDDNVRYFLKKTLMRDKHTVAAVDSGEAALKIITEREFDLALIDLNLGRINGMEVLTALHRTAPDTVSIVLTAHASLETSVDALRKGAHDYLFKPCKTVDLRESVQRGLQKRERELQQRDFLSQIQSLADQLKSIQDNPDAVPLASSAANSSRSKPSDSPTEEDGRFLQLAGLIIDSLRHVITLDGELLELSPTEFSLLAYLISEAPRVVPPQELVREVQGYESEQWEASETVRQHVHRIRQKIKEATQRTDVIRTVRGVGYTINS